MKKIYSVDNIGLALNKSNPPLLVITADGTANTGGWSGFILRPLWNRTNPPVNGVYEFSFEGVPPTGIVTQVLTPTGPVFYTLNAWDTQDARRIVIYAASNYQSVDRYTQKQNLLVTNTIVDLQQNAVGYSDTWDLGEAFRDAIKNLPPDPNPYPDKLYHFTITSIEAEVGGIAGLDRMKLIIEA